LLRACQHKSFKNVHSFFAQNDKQRLTFFVVCVIFSYVRATSYLTNLIDPTGGSVPRMMTMSNTFNSVILRGNVTADPVAFPKSNPFGLRFSLAQNDSYTKKDGTEVKEVHFFDIETLDKLTSFDGLTAEDIKKGAFVLVTGRLTTESWEDDQNKKHKRVKIVAQMIQPGKINKEEAPTA